MPIVLSFLSLPDKRTVGTIMTYVEIKKIQDTGPQALRNCTSTLALISEIYGWDIGKPGVCKRVWGPLSFAVVLTKSMRRLDCFCLPV